MQATGRASVELQYAPVTALVKASKVISKRASNLEEKATSSFSAGNFREAYETFSMALVLGKPPLHYLRSQMPDLLTVRVTTLFNRAIAAFRLGWFLHCVTDCTLGIAENTDQDYDMEERRELPITAEACHDAAVACKTLLMRAAAWEALGFVGRAQGDLRLLCQVGETGGDEPAPSAVAAARAREILERLEQERGKSSSAPGMLQWELLPEAAHLRVGSMLSLVTLARLGLLCRQSNQVFVGSLAWEDRLHTVLGPLGDVAEVGQFHQTCRREAKRRVTKLWNFRKRRVSSLTEIYLEEQGEAEEEEEYGEVSIAEIYRRAPIGQWLRRWLNSPLPIIVDIGTICTKMGFAGNSYPVQLQSNFAVVGAARVLLLDGMLTHDRDLLSSFMESCVIQSLGVDPLQHPLVFALPPAHAQDNLDDENRAVMARACRDLGFPMACGVDSAILALLGYGQETGVVLDIGMAITRAIPVINGEICRAGICTEVLGGGNATNYLLEKLEQQEEGRGLEAEPDPITKMILGAAAKEDYGYAAASAEEAESARELPMPFLSAHLRRSVRLGSDLAVLGEMFFRPAERTVPRHSYLGAETPQPRRGLHELVVQAVRACPKEQRAALLSCIVLSGGTSGIAGMVTRLQAELTQVCTGDLAGSAPRVMPYKLEPVWYGASLVGAAMMRGADQLFVQQHHLSGVSSDEEDEDVG